MSRRILYLTNSIPYTIIRSSRRKTSEIQVGEHGIVVRVPNHKGENEVWSMLEKKEEWICKKYLEFQTEKKYPKTKLNESYIELQMKRFAAKISVKPSKILIKPLKTRWGSATLSGVITINSRLLSAPKDVIDYVIVHELCHLKIRGHSRSYWNLVGMYISDYEKKIEWLRKHGRFI